MSAPVRYIRICIGYAFIHLAYWALPPGRVKREYWSLIDQWGRLINERLAELEGKTSS